VPTPKFDSVEEYLAAQPENVRAALEQVRDIFRRALPTDGEAIKYQIIGFRLADGSYLYLAGWKNHYSIYPATPELIAKFKDELEPYEVEKGTIRFPLSKPVPTKLIDRIAKFFAKEAQKRAEAKATTKASTKGKASKKG
jgi:uncharacterized protein YdhG (YjbR/CyaY superfamily)